MPTLDLRLIAVPYHLGQPRVSTGRGPEALLAAGAQAAVEQAGWQATVEVVEVDEEPTNEIGAAFAVSRALAARVRAAAALRLIGVLAAVARQSASTTA